jgi:hypothetical protein
MRKRTRKHRLQNACVITRIFCKRRKLLSGGGQANPKKRKQPTAQTPSGAREATAAELERLLDTCMDTQFAEVIHEQKAGTHTTRKAI